MATTPKRRAIVIGGSLGGLNAALWLQRVGYDVDILERSPKALFGRGAGIVLHPATVQVLETNGVDTNVRFDLDSVSLNTKQFVFAGMTEADDTVHSQSFRLTSYNSLLAAFSNQLQPGRYHLAHKVVRIEQNNDEHNPVSVYTEDGVKHNCEILVCVDGSTSDARERLVKVASETTFSGYIAWRGIVRRDELPEEIRRRFDMVAVYHIGENSHALCYPIPHLEGDADSTLSIYMNWLWYRQVDDDAVFREMMTDINGTVRERSVPPGYVQGNFIDVLRQDACILPPEFQSLLRATKTPFIQVVCDVSIERMRSGRIFFIGDAAFTTRPHIASATAKAAEDARTLAFALKEDGFTIGGKAVDQWEQNQLSLGRACVERSRILGESLQSGQYDTRSRIEFGLHQSGNSQYDTA